MQGTALTASRSAATDTMWAISPTPMTGPAALRPSPVDIVADTARPPLSGGRSCLTSLNSDDLAHAKWPFGARQMDTWRAPKSTPWPPPPVQVRKSGTIQKEQLSSICNTAPI